MVTALITGITGQDGGYLAKLLLEKGYLVYGMYRRTTSQLNQNIIALKTKYPNDLILRYGDLTDSGSLNHLIQETTPDEIYNLGAQSHVGVSFENPEYTANVDGLGTLRLLEAVRQNSFNEPAFYQASTSELFGKVAEIPQKETTPFHPRSPYGVAKLMAYWAVRNYRESYGMFACNGILFNHESENRGAEFVTRKITMAVAGIAKGTQKKLYLGNLDAKRDWGYALDYCDAMWRILQQDEPDDYVIATGETHTVREFTELAFQEAGYEIKWVGKCAKEIGVDKYSGKTLVEVDPKFYRPAEVDLLIGDSSKAREKLGWEPKTSFRELVSMMVAADLAR